MDKVRNTFYSIEKKKAKLFAMKSIATKRKGFKGGYLPSFFVLFIELSNYRKIFRVVALSLKNR